MSSDPTFSVVVPAFEAAARIAAVTRSVLGQTRSDLELIVVDDGSADATAEVAERAGARDPRARVISQPNAGHSEARNTGIEAAQGRFVSFLDDDDLWLHGYLAAVGPLLEAGGAVGLAHADAWVLDGETGQVGARSAWERFALPVRKLEPVLTFPASLGALLRVNFVTTCASTVSREALDAVGGFDPAMGGCDDWDLWLRIAGAGFGVAGTPERLAVRRMRAGSLGSDERMMARSALVALDAALARPIDDRRAERTARRHRAVLAGEVRALAAGSMPRRALWGAARRIGRKRIPLPGSGRARQPSGELAAALRAMSAGS